MRGEGTQTQSSGLTELRGQRLGTLSLSWKQRWRESTGKNVREEETPKRMVWIFVGDALSILLRIDLHMQEKEMPKAGEETIEKSIGRTIPRVPAELTIVPPPTSQAERPCNKGLIGRSPRQSENKLALNSKGLWRALTQHESRPPKNHADFK